MQLTFWPNLWRPNWPAHSREVPEAPCQFMSYSWRDRRDILRHICKNRSSSTRIWSSHLKDHAWLPSHQGQLTNRRELQFLPTGFMPTFPQIRHCTPGVQAVTMDWRSFSSHSPNPTGWKDPFHKTCSCFGYRDLGKSQGRQYHAPLSFFARLQRNARSLHQHDHKTLHWET